MGEGCERVIVEGDGVATGDGAPVGQGEPQNAVGGAVHGDAVIMDRAVVLAAQQGQVPHYLIEAPQFMNSLRIIV